MYYLQSRYYDPKVGRFINADGLVSTGQGILGNNMFAYCGNSPVNRTDPTGQYFYTYGVEDSNPLQNIINHYLGNGCGSGGVSGGASSAVATAAVVYAGAYVAATREQEESGVFVTTRKTDNPDCQYWEADYLRGSVVVGNGLTFQEASTRVACGMSIMCANQGAAIWIIVVNGYWNAVGPEIHGADGYYWHYHPNRNTHTHIWYYGG